MMLQRNLLSERLPVLPGVRVAGHYLVAGRELSAGGDWFDALALDDGRVALVVGDVVGHGPGASAVRGQLRAVLHERLAATGDLAVATGDLDGFVRRTDAARATTVCVALLEPTTGRLAYVCCGHPAPVLTGPGGVRSLPLPAGRPLGVGDEAPGIGTTTLSPGEAVLLYSDGLVERRDRTLAEGRTTLETVVEGAWMTPPVPGGTLPGDRTKRMSALTVERMTRLGHEDDVTLLVAERLVEPLTPLRIDLTTRSVDAADVRARLRSWLAPSGLSDDDVAALDLVVTEAVANVVDHAYRDRGGDGLVRVRGVLDRTGQLALDVEDQGRWRPPRATDDQRGRGLLLMRAFVDDLAVSHGDGGTHVAMRRRLHTSAILGTAPAGDATGAPRAAVFDVAQTDEHTARITISGALDTASTEPLRRAVREALRGDRRHLDLDLADVDLLGSTAVRELHGLAAELDGGLRVHIPTGSIPAQVLELVGLGHVVRPPGAPEDRDPRDRVASSSRVEVPPQPPGPDGQEIP